MNRRKLRAVPALVVGVLLVVAVLSSQRVRARSEQSIFDVCASPAQQQLDGSDSVAITPGGGVIQPLTGFVNVAACSIGVRLPFDSYVVLDWLQWDPVALAPDPSTVAFRSDAYDPSRLEYESSRLSLGYSRPIVTQALTGVAEPPRGSLALAFRSMYFSAIDEAFYRADAPSALPLGWSLDPSRNVHNLRGSHPGLTHVVCRGVAGSPERYVLQSVMTCDTLLDPTLESVAQKFRVPSRVEAEWVEFAFPQDPNTGLQTLTVAIFDGQGQGVPPITPQNPLGSKDIGYADRWPQSEHWAPMPMFDQPVVLEPGHDYWLVGTLRKSYFVYARRSRTTETSAFHSGIGVMFTRTSSGTVWSPRPEANLAFRLIGTASTVTAVTPPPAPRAAFALRVSPNPSTGTAFVEWRDAHGPVRIDVLDAHGRRVGGGEGAAASGRWLWSATRIGTARAAGVYFVRATDGEGRVAVERLVRVR